MSETRRDAALSTLAVLFALLALSDLLKPFRLEGGTVGFVFFGTRLSGAANAIVGPLFGVFLLAYAGGIWRMKRYALPMAYAYAAYVILNLILFATKNAQPAGIRPMLFGIAYIVIAVGVSSGAAILLTRRKAQLA